MARMQTFNATSAQNLTHTPTRDQVSVGLITMCFLLGVSGNVVVIAVIGKNFRKDNFTLRLMLNLAASDILCLLPLPAFMHALLSEWSFGSATCKALSFTIYTSLWTGLLTVVLMSVHRYVAVVYPHHWSKVGKTKERALLVSVWISACVLASCAADTYDVVKDGGKSKCWRVSMSDGKRAAVVLSETVFGFAIPFPILVASYCCLHKKVNQAAFFSSQKLTRLVSLIVVTFFVLWIPVHILNLVDIFAILIRPAKPGVYEELSRLVRLSDEVVKSFTFINSSVNPFLYAFSSRRLRKSGKPPETTGAQKSSEPLQPAVQLKT